VDDLVDMPTSFLPEVVPETGAEPCSTRVPGPRSRSMNTSVLLDTVFTGRVGNPCYLTRSAGRK